MSKIEKNEIYELEIMDLGEDGEGIAKLGNFIICVPDVMMGDVVKVRLVKVRKNIAYGKVIQMIKPS
ncbi:MAG: TRAM domain-containing protein, partial [Cellulosilyticaceae bacterium]